LGESEALVVRSKPTTISCSINLEYNSEANGYYRKSISLPEGFKAKSVTLAITGLVHYGPFVYEVEFFSNDHGTKPSCKFAPWKSSCKTWNDYLFTGDGEGWWGFMKDPQLPPKSLRNQAKVDKRQVALMKMATMQEDRTAKFEHTRYSHDTGMTQTIDGFGSWIGMKQTNRAVACQTQQGYCYAREQMQTYDKCWNTKGTQKDLKKCNSNLATYRQTTMFCKVLKWTSCVLCKNDILSQHGCGKRRNANSICKVRKECFLFHKDSNGKFQTIPGPDKNNMNGPAKARDKPFQKKLYANAHAMCSVHCAQG